MHEVTENVMLPGYEMIRRLGRGAFGEVWQVNGPGGTPQALKLVDLHSGTDFRELRSLLWLRQIRHPHLLPVIGFWLLDDRGQTMELTEIERGGAEACQKSLLGLNRPRRLLVAMVLGEGNLESKLAEHQNSGRRGIPVQELVEYIEDAAKGIDHLNAPIHDFGAGPVSIQHRDIKPANILLLGGTAVICDFGVARALEESSVAASAMVGSPAYMAPESIEALQSSRAADQYSLAITYYHLRTGRLPFPKHAGPATVIHCHLMGKLDLGELPEPERQVIARATSVNPEQRYGSCREMAAALRSVAARDATVPSPQDPSFVQSSSIARSRRLAATQRDERSSQPTWRTSTRRSTHAAPRAKQLFVALVLLLLLALGFGSLGGWKSPDFSRRPDAVQEERGETASTVSTLRVIEVGW